VRIAVDNATGKEWACKIVTELIPGNTQLCEAKLLAQLDHPSIVQYREHFYRDGWLHIIIELVRGRDLMSVLNSRGSFAEKEAKHVCIQLASALAHCHDRGICHRDLKPENIMLVNDTDDGGTTRVKLIDFGLGGQLNNSDTFGDSCGTPSFVAPELLRRGPSYGSACDVWSLGVTLFCLLSGELPFQGTNLPELLASVRAGVVLFHDPVWRLVSQDACDAVKALLTVDPKLRPSAADALLTCPWFSTP
jgi:serine/threonine protein kinase